MPANLTPEYYSAEKRYKAAITPQDKLEALQEMLRAIPKHKGTDKMQGDIKKRISQMRKECAKKGGPKKATGISVKKTGEGQVVLKGAGDDQALDLPQRLSLKVKASQKVKKHKGTKHKLTLQLTWYEGDYEDGGLELG